MMALMLCITMMTVPVSAGTSWVNSDDIKYKVDGGYLYFSVTSESSVCDEIEIEELSLTGADESIRGKIIIPKEIQGGRVIKIDYAAFAYCNKMIEVEIPESIEDMYEYGGLGFCDKLESINVDSNNKKYSSDNGVLLNKENTEILLCPKAKRGKYTVPDTVKKFGNAFNGCAGLTQLELPDSIVKINKNAFSNCENLSKIQLSTKLKEIGSFAFWNCGLKEIDIPDSVTYIGSAAFKECYKLKKISLSKNMKEIETDTFDSCGFTEVYVPGNIKTIGIGAFSWCNKLEKVYIENGVKEISLSAFSACNLKKVFIPKGVKKIDNAFEVIKPKKNKAKIYGCKGSYAEKYAKKYKMPFVNISLAAPAKVTCKLKDKRYIKTTWSKVKGASGYAVYVKSSKNKKYKLIKYTKNRYISKGKLKNGIRYTFKVVPYVTVDKKKYFGKGKAASINVKGIITEADLFNKYPKNLNNKECKEIYGNIRSQVDEILYGEYDVKKDNTDRKWSLKAFKQALKNGMAGNIKAIVGAVSGKFFEEKKLEEEVALELLQGISKNSNLMGDILDETEKGYGISSKVYKIISSGYKNEKERAEFIKAVSNKTFSKKDIDATVKAVENNWDKIDKSFEGADVAINSAQVSLMVIMSMQANQNIIDELMQNIDKESILYNGLERIKDKQQKSFGRNFISEMLKENAFDEVAEKIASMGSGAFKPVDSCFQLLGYLIPGGDMDTTNKAVIASSNANVLDSAAMELFTKIVIKSGDIEELKKSYEIIYTAKLQSINDSVEYALKVANKSQKKKLKTYYNKYKSYLRYDKYISSCIENASKNR